MIEADRKTAGAGRFMSAELLDSLAGFRARVRVVLRDPEG